MPIGKNGVKFVYLRSYKKIKKNDRTNDIEKELKRKYRYDYQGVKFENICFPIFKFTIKWCNEFQPLRSSSEFLARDFWLVGWDSWSTTVNNGRLDK